MQVFDQGERPVSNMPYNSPALDDVGSSCFHEIGDLETRRNWCRVWCAPAKTGGHTQGTELCQERKTT